jgi:pilus assembly protein CpaD
MSIAAPKLRVLTTAAVVMAAAASIVLAACEDRPPPMPDYMGVALNDTDARHPIDFEERREVLHIDVPPRARHLSHNQVADMQRFVVRYKAEGVGRLSVSVANQTGSDAGSAKAVAELGHILREAGVTPSRVSRTRHSDAHGSRSMLRLSYARTKAIAPECGHWHRDIGQEPERVHYPEFGCATQRNLAGMVANSRDLQRPQDEQPRAAERRSQTWSKYIQPENSDAQAPKVKAEDTTKK